MYHGIGGVLAVLFALGILAGFLTRRIGIIILGVLGLLVSLFVLVDKES